MRTAARNRSSICGRASVSNAAIGCAAIDCVAAELCSVSETIVILFIEPVLLLGLTESKAKRCRICCSARSAGLSYIGRRPYELLRGGSIGVFLSTLCYFSGTIRVCSEALPCPDSASQGDPGRERAHICNPVHG